MIIYTYFLQKRDLMSNRRQFSLVINGNIGFNNYKEVKT